MNHYLRLVDQPMKIRFEFRKDRTKLAKDIIARSKDGAAPPETPGILQVILIMGKTPYGPYNTDVRTTKGIWEARHNARQTQATTNLNREKNEAQFSLESAHAELTRQNRGQTHKLTITGKMVYNLYRAGLDGVKPVTLRQVYKEFSASKESLIEVDRRKRKEGQISLGTFKTYKKRWVIIEQFLHKDKQADIPIENVLYKTATNLSEWMAVQSSAKGSGNTYDVTTIGKVVKLLKMLLNYALSKDYITQSTLATWKMASGSRAKPKPLSRAQMNHLESCALPPVLRYQCDSWLVAAELCLHYSDYMELPRMKFITADSGVVFIQHERSKQTGTSLLQTVNLTPRAVRLIEKYGGVSGLCYTSAAYFSKQLKKIARIADLRDKDGSPMALAFGQGRDTGLTRRSGQGANDMAVQKLGGWASTAPAKYYIDDAVGIVDNFASGLTDQD